MRGSDKVCANAFTRLSVSVPFSAPWRLFVLLLLVQSPTAEAQGNDRRKVHEAVWRISRDGLGIELAPSFTGTYGGAAFRTNRWGMRDKEYELTPPKGTYRIALLGSSFSMGGGVRDEQTHEALLEERLNREGPGTPRRRYEILNFSVGGYGPLQHVGVTEKKVFRFAPNSLLLVIHSIDRKRIGDHIISLIRAGTPIEEPYVRQTLEVAGITPGMQEPELRRRLNRVSLDLLRWSYQRIAQRGRQHGVRVVGILFYEPRPRGQEKFEQLAALASEAGIPLLDLKGVYEGHSLDAVKLAPDDVHLNVLGHKLVADRLYELLRDNDSHALQLGFAPRRALSHED